jgi:hypothetical protein
MRLRCLIDGSFLKEVFWTRGYKRASGGGNDRFLDEKTVFWEKNGWELLPALGDFLRLEAEIREVCILGPLATAK